MALLARVAERLYWGARYCERAEDTARVIRAFNDQFVDFPVGAGMRWEPLAAITGTPAQVPADATDLGEMAVLHSLIADQTNPSSIASSVEAARENLRTTREVVPREAWAAVNQLARFARAESSHAVGRPGRDWFLGRIIEISRRLDGVLESTMSRDAAYRMWRIGRLVERADMTTRVLGVRAASILDTERDRHRLEELQWMGVLRSVSALQMYQRAVRGPIEAERVLRFLMLHEPFPRSVRSCVSDLRNEIGHLSARAELIGLLDALDSALSECDPDVMDGAAIDAAMDTLQLALGDLHRGIINEFAS